MCYRGSEKETNSEKETGKLFGTIYTAVNAVLGGKNVNRIKSGWKFQK